MFFSGDPGDHQPAADCQAKFSPDTCELSADCCGTKLGAVAERHMLVRLRDGHGTGTNREIIDYSRLSSGVCPLNIDCQVIDFQYEMTRE